MSITLASLQERTARELTGYLGITANASSTDLGVFYSKELQDYDEDSQEGKYFKILTSTSTDNTYQVRRIEGNKQHTGAIKTYRDFPVVIGLNTTGAIFDVEPSTLTYWINDAIRNAFPAQSSPVVDSTLITDNILPNASFEEGTTAPTGWTASVATAAQSSTHLFGSYSCSLTTLAGNVYISSDSYPDLLRLAGSTVNFYCWVKCSVAATAKLAIYTLTQAGTATTTYSTIGGTSGVHTGGGEWELLQVENVSIPDISDPGLSTDLAEVKIMLVTATANTAYFDQAYLPFTTPKVQVPASIDKINQAWECESALTIGEAQQKRQVGFDIINENGTRYLLLKDYSGGKKLKLIGYKNYTSLTNDTDTLAIPTEQEKLVVYGACFGYLNALANALTGNDRTEVAARAKNYEQKFEIEKLKRSRNLGAKRLNKVV